ncbi:MAG: peptidylprolyl isomerase [Firmicutes bacterium]|nr:peptidylprolyl isomerase [Bacillota bacterium]
MFNKGKYAAALIITVLFLGFAGCGRGSSSGESTNGTTVQNNNETTTVETTPMPQQQAQDAAVVMVFEGEPIFENDLRFVAGIMGLTPDTEEAQNAAMAQLIEFMTVIHHANRHGLGITPEDMDEMLPVAEMNVGIMGLSGMITDERLVDFFAVGTLLSRLLDHYVTNYTPNIAEYQHEFAAFAEANRNFLADIQLKYIVNQDLSTMQNLHYRLTTEGTGNFDELAREHSFFYNVDGGAILYDINLFLQIFGLYDHDKNAIFHLQSGDVSHVFYIDDFFFLVYIQSRTEATDAEIEQAFVDTHTFAHRADSIDELLDGWIASADYTINHSVLEAMRQ